MNDMPLETQSPTEVAAGAGTRIAATAHVSDGACIGADCEVQPGAVIEAGAVIGDRVTVARGAQIRSKVRLDDDVYVGPQAIFADDVTRDRAAEQTRVLVGAGAFIGANATILSAELGRGAKIAAGAVVTQPVPPHAMVAGNPAQIQGYTDSTPPVESVAAHAGSSPGLTRLDVRGVHLQRFPEFSDLRGSLTVCDLQSEHMPFAPQRWFLVYDVPSREIRGAHAHRECHQFLVCVSGEVHVAVDDGESRAEVLLDEPTVGLYVPPLVWASQYRYDERTVLLALASHPYDSNDYIREYDQFLLEVEGGAERPGGGEIDSKS